MSTNIKFEDDLQFIRFHKSKCTIFRDYFFKVFVYIVRNWIF